MPPRCCLSRREDVKEIRNDPELNVQCSKCLPQSNEDLSGLDARNRTHVMADIDPDRSERCCVAQADAHRVRILRAEMTESNTAEHITAVVERRETQMLFHDGKR